MPIIEPKVIQCDSCGRRVLATIEGDCYEFLHVRLIMCGTGDEPDQRWLWWHGNLLGHAGALRCPECRPGDE